MLGKIGLPVFRPVGMAGEDAYFTMEPFVTYPAIPTIFISHDILLAIEGTEIFDGAQLKNFLIERTNPGQEVSVKVRRVDVDLTFHVVLSGG